MNDPYDGYDHDPYEGLHLVADNTSGEQPRVTLRRTPTEDQWDQSDDWPRIWSPDGMGGTIYLGQTNALVAKPAVGKTMCAVDIAQQFLTRDGHKAVWWNFDSATGDLFNRMRSFGLGPHSVEINDPDLWLYIDAMGYRENHPATYPNANSAGRELQHRIAEWADGSPTLFVIDTVERSGCPSDGAGINEWWDRMLAIIEAESNFTRLLLDHQPKNSESISPIGSQAKLARINGAALGLSGKGWSSSGETAGDAGGRVSTSACSKTGWAR